MPSETRRQSKGDSTSEALPVFSRLGMAMFYDTHAHLTDACYRADRSQVIERAREAGVGRIVCVGTDLESSQRAIQLSEEYPGLFAVVGWHPNHALEAPAD